MSSLKKYVDGQIREQLEASDTVFGMTTTRIDVNSKLILPIIRNTTRVEIEDGDTIIFPVTHKNIWQRQHEDQKAEEARKEFGRKMFDQVAAEYESLHKERSLGNSLPIYHDAEVEEEDTPEKAYERAQGVIGE